VREGILEREKGEESAAEHACKGSPSGKPKKKSALREKSKIQKEKDVAGAAPGFEDQLFERRGGEKKRNQKNETKTLHFSEKARFLMRALPARKGAEMLSPSED